MPEIQGSEFTLSRFNILRLRFIAFGVFLIATIVGCGQKESLAQDNNGANPSNALVSNQKTVVVPFKPITLDRIQPGTVIFDENQKGFVGSPNYSNLLLFVRGNLSEGNVEAVSSTVKYYGDLFNLVYLANVRKVGTQFELDKVSVGFSSKIGKRDVAVTSASANGLGLSLSVIGDQVLSGNEKALEDIKLIAKNATMALIDAPAVFRFEGKNQRMLVRFYIWVSEGDGRVGTAAWLLRYKGKELDFAQADIVYLPPNTIENRVMYVDKSHFNFLGLPGPEAFGLVSLPKGTPFSANDRLRRSGAANSFTKESFEELAVHLAETMNQK